MIPRGTVQVPKGHMFYYASTCAQCGADTSGLIFHGGAPSGFCTDECLTTRLMLNELRGADVDGIDRA